jgi:nucleoid DNA-binding protein
MNQLELANAIAQDLQIGAYDADRFLKAAIAKITATVSENVPVELMNLGTFTMRPNAPRVGRNPSTGAPIDIPAKWSVSFKIDKAFKTLVESVPLDNQAPWITAITALGINAQTDKPYTFVFEYEDEGVGIRASTIGRDETKPDSLDLRVTGPNDYSQKAKAIKTKTSASKKGRIVTYSIGAPGGMWDASADGQYLIEVLPGQVTDAQGNAIAAGIISSFICNVSGTWTPPPGPI